MTVGGGDGGRSTFWSYELDLKTSGAVQPGVPICPVIEAMSCWKKRERPGWWRKDT